MQLDDLLDLLSHSARRDALRELLSKAPSAECCPEGLGGANPVELHHVHLPKLADSGLIEWDPETDCFSRGPELETATPVLVQLEAFES